jgi:hypothetical protein
LQSKGRKRLRSKVFCTKENPTRRNGGAWL